MRNALLLMAVLLGWPTVSQAKSNYSRTQSQLVSESHHDGTEVTGGQMFTKVFRLKNTSSITWRGFYLTRVEPAGTSDICKEMTEIKTTAPGETCEIKVDMLPPNVSAEHWIVRFKITDKDKNPIFLNLRRGVWVDLKIVPGQVPVPIPAPALVINWFPVPGKPNWEAEKQAKNIPWRGVVIHHTGGGTDLTREELSRIGKTKLYDAIWPTLAKDPDVRHLPVQSGHFWTVGGQEVEHFCGYHLSVSSDGGRVTNLLDLDKVAWHAGNWERNMDHLAILINDDLTNKRPSLQVLQKVADVIVDLQEHFHLIVNLIGHGEVKSTACPGTWWTTADPQDPQKRTGKQMLLDLMQATRTAKQPNGR